MVQRPGLVQRHTQQASPPSPSCRLTLPPACRSLFTHTRLLYHGEAVRTSGVCPQMMQDARARRDPLGEKAETVRAGLRLSL